MTVKEFEQSYQDKKNTYHNYINTIKKNCKWDIYNIINPTLVKNPYASAFPKKLFSDNRNKANKILLFFKYVIKYYVKNIYLLISYFIAFILYKIYYKKQRTNDMNIIIDIFGLVDKANQSGQFSENYLVDVYEIFEKYATKYTILLRLYGVGKNPFKLKQFFKIINEDRRDFIFEYELLSFKDFINLFVLVMAYPFKTLRLLQKEKSDIDRIFNTCLIEDVQYFSFENLTRYILGKNLSSISTIDKVYSWSEFQVIERSFNYGIRKNTDKIELIALQFYLNYETYFNAYVEDIDYDMLSSPHRVLVNGKYYLQNRKKVKYDIGVSLRYKDMFLFEGIQKENYIVLLGSYIESDTKHMLESVKSFDNVIFKNHPAVNIKKFGRLPTNITVSNENIYKLFKSAKLVIGTASGTSVEAVACGVSVIIMASQDNLTANPLVEYGKGKIWDIAYSKDNVQQIYDKLIDYRKRNKEDLEQIGGWYKDNFFVEPTEEHIVKVFELEKERE